MTTYTRGQLESERNELVQEIHNLDMQRTTALLNGVINNFDFQLLGNEVNKMSGQVSNLNTQLVLRRLWATHL
jgi:hypothetical protein